MLYVFFALLRDVVPKYAKSGDLLTSQMMVPTVELPFSWVIVTYVHGGRGPG